MRDSDLTTHIIEGVQAVAVGVDVAADVTGAVASVAAAVALHAKGGLRLLVSNVGVSTAAPTLLTDHTVDEVDKIVMINGLFTMQLARAMWPLLANGATVATAKARAAATGTNHPNLLQALGEDRKSGLLFISSGSSLIPAPFVSILASIYIYLHTFKYMHI